MRRAGPVNRAGPLCRDGCLVAFIWSGLARFAGMKSMNWKILTLRHENKIDLPCNHKWRFSSKKWSTMISWSLKAHMKQNERCIRDRHAWKAKFISARLAGLARLLRSYGKFPSRLAGIPAQTSEIPARRAGPALIWTQLQNTIELLRRRDPG